MTTMMGGKDEIMQEMMDEKEGLCLSSDQVHMMCGIGTKLQEKMDAALKQCVPAEMMAATMMGGKDEIMQEMMDEKEGLCLSSDQVHMMCGIGTKLQEKM